MSVKTKYKLLKMPEMVLISGNGRNVGKTFLACEIIRKLSKKHKVTGLKISPHFHDEEQGELVFRNDDFIIFKENQFNQKDSSLMLQAGASQVYFVMTRQENLSDAFAVLKERLGEETIVCESGGLRDIVEPGMFLFVKRKNEQVKKEHLLRFSPIIINNDGKRFDFNIDRLQYKNKAFRLV